MQPEARARRRWPWLLAALLLPAVLLSTTLLFAAFWPQQRASPVLRTAQVNEPQVEMVRALLMPVTALGVGLENLSLPS